MASRKAQFQVAASKYRIASPADSTPFWIIWKEHQPFLLNLCKKWARGNEEEAQEYLHGGMLRAFDRTQGEMQTVGNPRAWLAKVIKSYVVDTYRKQQRNPQFLVEPDFLIQLLDRDRPHAEISPERSILRDESYLQLKAAIEELPDRLRSAMILRAYQEMAYKDIAEHLGIKPDTARKRVQEARDILRERIAQGSWEARGNRRPDPQMATPRTERRAADDILKHHPRKQEELTKYAYPVQVQVHPDYSIEWPVFRPRKPLRIAQRLQALRKYIDKHPRGWMRRWEYAGLLETTGEWREAIAQGCRVLAQQPQLARTRVDVARWMSLTGNGDEAMALLKTGMQRSSNPISYAILHAHLLFLEGNFDKSIQLTGFRVGEATTAPFPVFFEVLYHACLQNPDWEPELMNQPADREGGFWLSAYRALRSEVPPTVRALGAGDPYALHEKVLVALEQCDKESAKNRLKALQRVAPNSILYLKSRIAYLIHGRKSEKALETVHQLLESHPGNLMAIHLAARALNFLGATSHATTLLHSIPPHLPGQDRWKSLLPLYAKLPSCE